MLPLLPDGCAHVVVMLTKYIVEFMTPDSRLWVDWGRIRLTLLRSSEGLRIWLSLTKKLLLSYH